METDKSSRHAKISGDFGEALVLYWLSKHGYECASVDHTGIDIIASHPNKSKKLMGISVKCRSWFAGMEQSSVSIRSGDFEKVADACDEFRCDPYFAIVVDMRDKISVFITPQSIFLGLFPPSPDTGDTNWKVGSKAVASYANIKEIMHFELAHQFSQGWEQTKTSRLLLPPSES